MNTENEHIKSEKRHDRTGRSPMLTLIYKNQQRQSFAYAYLLESSYIESDAGDWITLNFGFTTVQLGGRGIVGIYHEITQHHAAELNEIEASDLSPNRGGILKINIIRPETGE
ncbi:hypothetical protein SH580_17065 [Coraliomargarita algicola]|uniref:Uncharacterized protein n=1 Tax=Coraliomargarita algicola TaxID=3092156 RepID=A0ABZ0RJN4_9BACT|nr:hypothetical protein [Coraliomargarita sp. J2-16]WPJ95137.1 hypothetical protein SH580_17065 [Coraliomargarita sp. J2-16]